MTDWLGLAVFAVLVVLALVAMSRLGGPRKEISVEEFEERARSGAFTRAGMFALQEVLDPKQAKAVAVQKDLKHGYYNKKRVPGDGDDEDEQLTPGEDERLTVRESGGGAAGESRAGGRAAESEGSRAAESKEGEERDA